MEQETPSNGLYVAHGGNSAGPLTVAELLLMWAENKIQAESLFWHEGMPAWVPIQSHAVWRRLVDSAPVPATVPTADDHERIFGSLLKESWRYHNQQFSASVVDDVFIGLLIACTLDNGWSLIDMTSDGSNHYLRFENFKDQSRVYYQVRHMTHSLAEQKAVGNRVAIVVGYGERTNDFARLWSTLKQELRSGYIQSPEPGTITFDADMGAGYIYVQVDMFWKMEDYVGEGFHTDGRRLDRDVDACTHALRKYLRGRTGRAQ